MVSIRQKDTSSHVIGRSILWLRKLFRRGRQLREREEALESLQEQEIEEERRKKEMMEEKRRQERDMPVDIHTYVKPTSKVWTTEQRSRHKEYERLLVEHRVRQRMKSLRAQQQMMAKQNPESGRETAEMLDAKEEELQVQFEREEWDKLKAINLRLTPSTQPMLSNGRRRRNRAPFDDEGNLVLPRFKRDGATIDVLEEDMSEDDIKDLHFNPQRYYRRKNHKGLVEERDVIHPNFWHISNRFLIDDTHWEKTVRHPRRDLAGKGRRPISESALLNLLHRKRTQMKGTYQKSIMADGWRFHNISLSERRRLRSHIKENPLIGAKHQQEWERFTRWKDDQITKAIQKYNTTELWKIPPIRDAKIKHGIEKMQYRRGTWWPLSLFRSRSMSKIAQVWRSAGHHEDTPEEIEEENKAKAKLYPKTKDSIKSIKKGFERKRFFLRALEYLPIHKIPVASKQEKLESVLDPDSRPVYAPWTGPAMRWYQKDYKKDRWNTELGKKRRFNSVGVPQGLSPWFREDVLFNPKPRARFQFGGITYPPMAQFKNEIPLKWPDEYPEGALKPYTDRELVKRQLDEVENMVRPPKSYVKMNHGKAIEKLGLDPNSPSFGKPAWKPQTAPPDAYHPFHAPVLPSDRIPPKDAFYIPKAKDQSSPWTYAPEDSYDWYAGFMSYHTPAPDQLNARYSDYYPRLLEDTLIRSHRAKKYGSSVASIDFKRSSQQKEFDRKLNELAGSASDARSQQQQRRKHRNGATTYVGGGGGEGGGGPSGGGGSSSSSNSRRERRTYIGNSNNNNNNRKSDASSSYRSFTQTTRYDIYHPRHVYLSWEALMLVVALSAPALLLLVATALRSMTRKKKRRRMKM